MAYYSNQAWVTSCVSNEHVHNALVLQNSIRKTQTTKQLVCVTSLQVSFENRNLLRQAFDMLFLLDEVTQADKINLVTPTEVIAKAYTFALVSFSKCVYVPANSVILKNADQLFETSDNFYCQANGFNDSLNLSVFMVTPSKEIWIQIWHSIVTSQRQDISEDYLGTWLLNQKAILNTGLAQSDTVAQFCLTTGNLRSGSHNAAVVHFVGDKEVSLARQIKLVEHKKDVGLVEKIIARMWLNLYQETLLIISRNDKPAVYLGSLPKLGQANEPIAIVGMSCRYPGANNLEEFWNLLYAGEEGIREPPAFRWTKEHAIRVTQQDRKIRAGFLNMPVDEFDAGFFAVSPKEAEFMDPQTRILHEVMWESLEDAGINPQSLYGTHTGIFTGSWMNDYKEILLSSGTWDEFFRTYMGNSIGAGAARLSFLLGLTGPCIATESGCSSAIVALDLAVKSLRAGEINLGIAGGVNLLLHPFTAGSMEHVISPDGRCKTFDADANGFVRSEGCGVLVVKRLSDAMRDGDNIWAVIRGSAVSQEGLSRSLGTPTVHGEALAMQLALKDANVLPEEVSFVETHGTGTEVGDPMEVAAVTKAYHTPNRKTPLVIGSVKTNVGHTESCSGITGLQKAVLAMQHEIIPKHRNFKSLNPEIFLDSIPAVLPLENMPWPKIEGQRRICGVSSFGITGTDGHVIIEEAPDYQMPTFKLGLERPIHLFKISGKTSDALEELLSEYQTRFSEHAEKEDNDFADLAYSANVGRAAFKHRAFVLASGYQDAAKMLNENRFSRGEVNSGSTSKICFLFTGQGSQYPGMAKMLYETSPVFRVSFDACDRVLRETFNLSIREVLWESNPDSKELSRTIYSQTSIFCVEYCLFKLWQSWGIKPDYVLGHSLGEFCAAVAAGVLTFEDVLKLVGERSRLIDNLPRGSMLVIKASKPEVEKWMKAAQIDLDFAAVNNPDQTVVAGDTKTVEAFKAYLKGQGTKTTILEATHAFHSRHMDPMLEQYRKIAQSINYKQGNSNIQYVSGLEGRLIDNVTEVGPDYWVRHTREKVAFLDACAALKETGCTTFVEIGPQPVLSSFVMLNIEGLPLNCLPSLRKGTNDWETILTSLGKLYLLGYQVDWKGYDEPYIRKKLPLPFYPFHRKSFWADCGHNNATILHPLLGHSIQNASALHIFQNDLLLKSVPYLKDHCLRNRPLFPAAGFAEMCLSAGHCISNGLTENLEQPTGAICLENLRIGAPLELIPDKRCRLQTVLELAKNPEDDTCSKFLVKIFHQSGASADKAAAWVPHASATFIPVPSLQSCMTLWNPNRASEMMSLSEPVSASPLYKYMAEAGLKLGPTFQTIRRYWTVRQPNCKVDCDEILAEMEMPQDWNQYSLHPLIIDCIIITGLLSGYRYVTGTALRVPVSLAKLILFGGIDASSFGGDRNFLYLHVWQENGKHVCFISSPDHSPVAYAEDLELLSTNVATIESILEMQTRVLPDAWEETWRAIPGPGTSQVAPVEDVKEEWTKSEFLDKAKGLQVDSELERELYAKNRRLVYLFILNACQELGWKPEVGEELELESFCTALGIQNKYRKLVRFYLTVFEEDGGILRYLEGPREKWVVTKVPKDNNEVVQEMNKLTKELSACEIYAKVTRIQQQVGKNLAQILTGKVDPVSMLFPTEQNNEWCSADAYYQSLPCREKVVGLMELVSTSAFQRSEVNDANVNGGKGVYRVLEVGAGTGGCSGHLLSWLRNVWGTRFELYYTDMSKAGFSKAEEKFKDFRENMKFEVFNIEQSPLAQGIPLGYFDMVVGSDVLHATRNLEETLGNLRQTLKPGGILCFTETVVPARDITFVFGLLEGYWRFEDFDLRPHHCCVGERVWGEIMYKTGYKDFSSFTACMDQVACLVATADPTGSLGSIKPVKIAEPEMPVWIIFANEYKTGLWSKLASTLGANGCKVILALKDGKLNCVESHVEQVIVGVDEQGAGQLEALLGSERIQGVVYGWGIDEQETDQKNVALPFLHIAKILVAQDRPPRVYVLTQEVHPVTDTSFLTNPTAATLFGMGKSLKNELFELLLRCVDLEQGASEEEHLNQVLFELAMHKGLKEQHRVQVAYRGGLRYEAKLGKAQLHWQGEELKLPQSTDRYRLKLPESKLVSDIKFEHLEMESVKKMEIEVKTKAYSLNFRDIFAILKPSKQFENCNGVGVDYAGVVTKAGEDSPWKVGQRVFGCNFKGDKLLPSHLVVDSKCVCAIPEKMTYWEASTFPLAFCTAYHCLIRVANIKKGDKVLIHTGSGGVGLAAIQFAKMVEAEIITTAGNPRKRAYLRGLGIQHVFHSRDTSFEQDILRVTNGQGVDIVLNSITGPGMKEATLRATAKNGRFIEMSKLSVWSNEEVKELRPDVDYNIVDLMKVDPEISLETQELVNGLLNSGSISPVSFVKFDALRLRQALQYFQKAKHIGKVVVTMPEVNNEQGQFKTEVPLFNSKSTYLITGGLGGIGFEVCKWMLTKGATDIVLTGRGAPQPEIAEQIAVMQKNGFKVEVKLGDMGDFDQCFNIIQDINQNGKPLRGIMHCAGVLRDNLYPNQTWNDFQATFNPKVDATWNLHKCTKDLLLEHFVMFSSVSALMGTPGQPNYAAANCFEDAFIHYRHSLGLPGLSINWGQWAQVGCAKDLNIPFFSPVSVSRMLNGLDTALKTNQRQIGLVDFSSISTLRAVWPLAKFYLDEKVLKQYQAGSAQGQLGQNLNAEKFWAEMDAVSSKTEKVGVLSGYLKSVMRTALRMDPEEKLSENADIHELGVDSLMKIELKNAIQNLLGNRVNITASMLENCNTIQQISEAMVVKIMEQEGDPGSSTNLDKIPLEPLPSAELLTLLQTDCQLPEMVQITPDTEPAVSTANIKTVLVTGATGQLAPYLVAEICKGYKSVKKIYCLVHGQMDTAQALEKLENWWKKLDLLGSIPLDRIEGVAGNVSLVHLGFVPEMYDKLSREVDAVIHCAARTHPAEHLRAEMGTAEHCRSVNIFGTRNILKFACTGKVKRVFYPSTVISGLFGKTETAHLEDTWPEANMIGNIIDKKFPGLQTSKWICEMLMEQANERGIPCKVFRLPWLAGSSQNGKVILSRNLYVPQFLTFLKLGAIPDIVAPAIGLPVDLCAEVAVKLFMQEEAPNQIFYVVHPRPQLELEFVRVAKEKFGKTLEIVEWNQFAEKLDSVELGELENALGNMRALNRHFLDSEAFVKAFVITPDTYFANERVAKLIPNYGDNFPSSMETVVQGLKFVRETGLWKHLDI